MPKKIRKLSLPFFTKKKLEINERDLYYKIRVLNRKSSHKIRNIYIQFKRRAKKEVRHAKRKYTKIFFKS